jgi:D-galactarolactone cycloisomerase
MGRFDPDYELGLMRDVRAQVPKNVRLMIDAWGSYTLPTALRVGRALQEMDFFWHEPIRTATTPTRSDVRARHRDRAARTPRPEAAKALFDRRAVDILQPDVSLCGGIADSCLAAEPALYGIRCPHSFTSAITAAASAHAASLLPRRRSCPAWTSR